MTQLRWGSATDTGQVRTINQDGAYTDESVFAVADGMGGHRGGEVASAVALETLVEAITAPTADALIEGVRIANSAVYRKAQDEPDLRGMGTTLCAIAIVSDGDGERLGLVNVGDSRVYLLRDGGMHQLTEDHSLVESLVRQGRITEEEALVHPQRNILTRALGISASVDVDAWELQAVTGDRYLLCSDGLFNEVEPQVIEATLRKLADPGEAANELVRLANEGGGRDNITTVVLDVVEGDGEVAVPVRLTEVAEPDLGSMGRPPDTVPQPVVQLENAPDLPPAPGAAAGAAAAGAAGGVAPSAPPPPPAPGGVATDVTTTLDPAPAAGGAAAPAVPGADADTAERAMPLQDAPPPPAAGEEPVAPAKRRRVTWRVLVFVVALFALVVLVGWLVTSYARSSYFVTFEGDEVVIEQGRPGGFLLWQPTVEERTGIERDDLQDVAVERVEEEASLGSLDDAQRFVENLELVGDESVGDAAEGSSDEGEGSSADEVSDTVRTPTTEAEAPDKPTR